MQERAENALQYENSACTYSFWRLQIATIAADPGFGRTAHSGVEGSSMKINLAGIATSIVLAFSTAYAYAQPALADGDLVIEDARTRAMTPDEKSAAVYLTIDNTGNSRIDLIGVRTDRALIETMHKTEIDTQGNARMNASPNLRIASSENLILAPGGLHVMLIDLKTPLIEDELLPLRLEVYDGDDLTGDVPILAADATGPMP